LYQYEKARESISRAFSFFAAECRFGKKSLFSIIYVKILLKIV